VDGMLNTIAQIYGQNQQLPLQYGSLYQNAYDPYFKYAGQQGTNLAGLGQQNIGTIGQVGQGAMNLYGSLANTQADMYQAELPFQMQSQMFNSLAPVLSGLLGQGGFSGLPEMSPIQMSFQRPNVMGGFNSTANQAYRNVNNAYNQSVGNARAYDGQVDARMSDMMEKMPTPPYMNKPQAPPPPPRRPRPRPSSSDLYSLSNPASNLAGYARAYKAAYQTGKR